MPENAGWSMAILFISGIIDDFYDNNLSEFPFMRRQELIYKGSNKGYTYMNDQNRGIDKWNLINVLQQKQRVPFSKKTLISHAKQQSYSLKGY